MSQSQQPRRNAAIRVAFITDSIFDKENEAAKGALKKRALQILMKHARYPVIESSNVFDTSFYIMRQPGAKAWMLRKVKDESR